jgi:hypothetical protein
VTVVWKGCQIFDGQRLDELSQTQPRAGRNLTDADTERRSIRIEGARFGSAAAGGNRERHRQTRRDE